MPSKKKRNEDVKPREKKTGIDNRGISRFILHYLILMAAFVFLKESEFIQNIIDINGLYSNSIALFTSKALGMIGIASAHYGSIIELPSVSLDIKFGCNGLEAVMIYAIGVSAFPGNWRRKLTGILIGLIILQIINLARIVSLAWSAVYYKAAFETLHIYIAPGIMIAVALFSFLIYINMLAFAQSSLSNQQPVTSNQQPATGNQQPATRFPHDQKNPPFPAPLCCFLSFLPFLMASG